MLRYHSQNTIGQVLEAIVEFGRERMEDLEDRIGLMKLEFILLPKTHGKQDQH